MYRTHKFDGVVPSAYTTKLFSTNPSLSDMPYNLLYILPLSCGPFTTIATLICQAKYFLSHPSLTLG